MLHHRIQLILAITAMLWLLIFKALSYASPIVIMTDGGGDILGYVAHKNDLAKSGQPVEIKGSCASACTVYLGLENVCVYPQAWLGFHQTGSWRPNQPEDNRLLWDEYLWRQYPVAIQMKLQRLGPELVWFRGYELPIRQCR